MPVDQYCAVADVDEAQVRAAAALIAAAESVAVYEDLGVQMNRDSTLVSYVEKLVWLLTGNFAKPGAQYVPSNLSAIGRDRGLPIDDVPRSPVVGAPIISGLVPCNVIAEEILTDHPARYRAMIVESSNPAHSLADSAHMREAFAALDLLVVIDVAMTETARLADYVLPAPTQFEKYEATFFNFDFPRNILHLRHPVATRTRGTARRARDPRPPRRSRRGPDRAGLRTAARSRRAGAGRVRRSVPAVDGRPRRCGAWRRCCCTGRWVPRCPTVRPRPRCSGQPPTSSPRATPPGSSRPATVRGSRLASSSSRRSCPGPMVW